MAYVITATPLHKGGETTQIGWYVLKLDAFNAYYRALMEIRHTHRVVLKDEEQEDNLGLLLEYSDVHNGRTKNPGWERGEKSPGPSYKGIPAKEKP